MTTLFINHQAATAMVAEATRDDMPVDYCAAACKRLHDFGWLETF